MDYIGRDGDKLADIAMRDRITRHVMQEKCFQLTARRVAEESTSSGAPGAVTSILKYVGSTLSKDGSELKSMLRGIRGLGWAGRARRSPMMSSNRLAAACATAR